MKTALSLQEMEDENHRLKLSVAELILDLEALKDVIRKNGVSVPHERLMHVGLRPRGVEGSINPNELSEPFHNPQANR